MAARKTSRRKRNEPAELSPRASKSREATARLRDELIRRLKPGDGFPTLKATAERLAVSLPVVRRAVAQLVREGWIEPERVGRGYVVTQPRRRPIRTSGLLFPFIAASLTEDLFYREAFSGLLTAASANGRQVIPFLGGYEGFTTFAPAVFWSPNMRLVDSVLTLELFDDGMIERVAELYPVVCLDYPCRLAKVSSLVFDHAASVRMAFKHLLDLGHRRIGFVGRSVGRDPAVAERLAAYRGAFAWSGLSPDRRWELIPASVAYPTQDMAAIVEQMLAQRSADRPTALIAVDAFWATVARLLRGGLRVPEQMSVVGVGAPETWQDYYRSRAASAPDYRLFADMGVDFAEPFRNRPAELAALCPTCIALPAREMGRRGMLELIRRRADLSADPGHEVLAPNLLAGNSVASPPRD